MARTDGQGQTGWGWGRPSAYETWIQSVGIPIHRGYFIEDVRTLELGEWEERECHAAFVVLAGQEGVSEARVSEIPPGHTLPPLRFALDEIVYVAQGRGLTTIWAGDGPKKTFEWHTRSIFLIPRGCTYQLTNTQGNAPVRLLHTNSLPMSMNLIPDPDFYLNSPYTDPDLLYKDDFYSAAKEVSHTSQWHASQGRQLWYGNFFPDMAAWDRLHTYQERGAGGHRVGIQFPNCSFSSHMSVFPARTYKKAHRHGPGVVIIIPAGEGYSIMWPEGQDKVIVPWHEASVFVPPDRWFHQHFNVGAEPARYLAFHPPGRGQGNRETIEDRQRDEIQYPAEESFIRERFEQELGKRAVTSLMPEKCYKDPNYQWEYESEE